MSFLDVPSAQAGSSTRHGNHRRRALSRHRLEIHLVADDTKDKAKDAVVAHTHYKFTTPCPCSFSLLEADVLSKPFNLILCQYRGLSNRYLSVRVRVQCSREFLHDTNSTHGIQTNVSSIM